jgi:hypothetical protein
MKYYNVIRCFVFEAAFVLSIDPDPVPYSNRYGAIGSGLRFQISAENVGNLKIKHKLKTELKSFFNK